MPKLFELLQMGGRWAWRRRFPSPADRFAAVVRQVMARDERILARKYCDRWLLRVHGRGLNQRLLQHHEKGQAVLPFPMPIG